MLYDLAIVIYDFIVHLAAPFSRKPRKMMKGHWVVYELLRQQVEKGEQYIWFHAASLGEFEQGRPLIEMIRAKYPDYKILLTFSLLPVTRCVSITGGRILSAICRLINRGM